MEGEGGGGARRQAMEIGDGEWRGAEEIELSMGLITVGNVRVPIQRNDEGLCGGGL